jgi:hypothetical protein
MPPTGQTTRFTSEKAGFFLSQIGESAFDFTQNRAEVARIRPSFSALKARS